MIAPAEKDRDRAERSHLVGKEVAPGKLLIGGNRELAGAGPKGQQVLIRRRHGAEIAEVPVEGVFVSLDLGGDGRHHEVAAVAAVAGDGKCPGGAGGLSARQIRRKRRNDDDRKQGRGDAQPEHALSITQPARKGPKWAAYHVWEDSDRKSTRLNSSHLGISYAVFCFNKKNIIPEQHPRPLQTPRHRTTALQAVDS